MSGVRLELEAGARAARERAHSGRMMNEDPSGEEGGAESLDILLRRRGGQRGVGSGAGSRGGLPPLAMERRKLRQLPHLVARAVELIAPPAAIREAPTEHGRLEVQPPEQLDGG